MKRSDKIGFTFGGIAVILLTCFIYAFSAISSAEQRARLAEDSKESSIRELDDLKEKQKAIESKANHKLEKSEQILKEVQEALAKLKAPLGAADSIVHIEDSEERRKIIESLGLRHFPTDNRLDTGKTLVDKIKAIGGKGKLTLINGLTEDAHVKIIYQGALAASFYVRSSDEYTYATIPDGTFTVMYCVGYGWNNSIRDFQRGRSASKYDAPLTFTTRQQRDGNYITTTTDSIRLSLHKVIGGNATTSPLSLDEFDKY